MSKIKAFAEQVSVEMGYGGELTPEVLAEADRRLKRSNHRTGSEYNNNASVDHTEEDPVSERN